MWYPEWGLETEKGHYQYWFIHITNILMEAVNDREN